jgi:adenylate cyclase
VSSELAPGDAGHGARLAPSAEAVTQELEQVLASPDFVASDRLKRFLRFVVEETLAGRGDRLHAYPIALEVLGPRRELRSADRSGRAHGGR